MENPFGSSNLVQFLSQLLSGGEAMAQTPPMTENPYDKVMPILQQHSNKNFVQRILEPEKYPTIDMGDGSIGTHYMSSAQIGDEHMAFPLIVQDPETGTMKRFDDWRQAADYAKKTGEYIPFRDAESAEWFGKNYKSAWGNNWTIKNGKVVRGNQ